MLRANSPLQECIVTVFWHCNCSHCKRKLVVRMQLVLNVGCCQSWEQDREACQCSFPKIIVGDLDGYLSMADQPSASTRMQGQHIFIYDPVIRCTLHSHWTSCAAARWRRRLFQPFISCWRRRLFHTGEGFLPFRRCCQISMTQPFKYPLLAPSPFNPSLTTLQPRSILTGSHHLC
jgi:hypothetical protein